MPMSDNIYYVSLNTKKVKINLDKVQLVLTKLSFVNLIHNFPTLSRKKLYFLKIINNVIKLVILSLFVQIP